MPGAYERVQPVKDEVLYWDWSLAHPYCQACGVGARRAAWPGLSTHHIVKPGRSHEPCNLLRLCHACHRLAEGDSIRSAGGVLLPNYTLGLCLSLKRYHDSCDWLPQRLEQLYGRALPPLLRIPDDVEASYIRWNRYKANKGGGRCRR